MPIATARQIGRRPRRKPLWTSREAFFTDLGLFLLGVVGAFSVNLVGALPGNEILLIPILPLLLLAKGGRAFKREYLWFYVLTLAWLLGTIVADLYVGSPAVFRMKGLARVVLFGLDFMALAILINNRTRRMIVFALSIVAVMCIFSRGFQGDFLTEWKFGISSAVTILALLGCSHYYARKKYRHCIVIYLVLIVLNLKFAFRSQMVVDLVAAVLTIPIFDHRGSGAGNRSSNAVRILKPVLLLALAGGAAFLASETIKFAAKQGFFDQDVADKFQSQSQGKLGVLFGGRPETLVAIQAIRDSPIIGHGSFAADQRYLDLKADLLYENGYSDSDEPDDIEGHGIPTHSHLTMAWVESGILGGVLWIYILVLVIRAILRITIIRPPLSPLYCYLLVNFVWDILYSPFGSINRLWGAYLILMSLDLLQIAPKKVLPSGLQRPEPLTRARVIVKRRLA
jgi:O-antigen ligase